MSRVYASLLAIGLLIATVAPVSADGPIRFGVYQNSPLVFVDDAGNAHGLVIDMLEHIAQQMGWAIEYVTCEWAQCLEWLEAGEIDLLGAIAYSQARTERFDFTRETLITNWGQVYAHPGTQIDSFIDLEGKTVVALREDIYTGVILDILEQFGVSHALIQVEDYPSVLARVEVGEADAGVVNRLFASQYASSYGVEDTNIIFHPVEVRFAATQGAHQGLLAALDEGLQALKADQDSAYYQALESWLGGAGRWRMPDWWPWVGGLAAGSLLVLILTSAWLRHQVQARTRELSAEVDDHRRTGEVLALSHRQAQSLIESARYLTESLDLDEVLQRIAQQAKDILDAYGIAVYLLSTDGKTLIPVISIEPEVEEQVLATPLPVNKSLTGQSVLARRGRIFNDLAAEVAVQYIPGTSNPVDERVLAVPFFVHDQVYGAMCLDRIGPVFTEQDLALAETLAAYASTALQNARAHSELRHEVAERSRAELVIQEYAEHLEEMVADRTRELENAQERLLRQERLATLGQLAGGVGHELRNPLGVITNAVYYLKMVPFGSDDTVQEYLELISGETKNAAKIVTDLLEFGRVGTAVRTPSQAADLVASVLERQISPEGVSVVVNLPADLPQIYVDAGQIKQVLANLVANACQAMPEGGQLSVTGEHSPTEGREEVVVLTVSDTGVGISADNMEKLFEPLFTTKARGIGLGLAISQKLVEANGGRITVESELGQGSTFAVWLPTAAAER